MLSIWAMTGSLWEPLSRVEGSLNEDCDWAVLAAAGDGVAGAAGADVFVEGAGAGGAAGVEAAALEGVEGACEGVAVEDEPLGWAGKRGQAWELRYDV